MGDWSPFFRGLAIAGNSFFTAIFIVVCLTIWLLAAAIGGTSTSIMKGYFGAVFCCAIPSAVATFLYFRVALPVGLICIGMWLFTDVLGALLIGNRLRAFFLPNPKPPEPLLLILPAVLLFVPIATFHYFYAVLPFFDWNPDSRVEALSAQVPILAALIILGWVLPVHTKRAVVSHGGPTNKAQIEPVVDLMSLEQALIVPQETRVIAIPSAPSAPSIPASNPPQRLQLKLKRSQRTGFAGKLFFVLDARIELTREETELVRKYRLGDDLVYESASRKQRKEASLAHLQMIDDGARSSDSVGHMLSVGKSFYRLARASLSATAAALSLRITIDSLIAGVHIECKSMPELLGAETAIIEAAQNIRTYLETAATFDGREEILEL